MNDCKHKPIVPFFVLFKAKQKQSGEEQVQFRCKKCGKIVVPNKRMKKSKFDFWIRFTTLCIYFLIIRDNLLKLFRFIFDLPNIVIRLFTVISGTILSVLLVDIILFVLLHCMKWKELNAEQAE